MNGKTIANILGSFDLVKMTCHTFVDDFDGSFFFLYKDHPQNIADSYSHVNTLNLNKFKRHS